MAINHFPEFKFLSEQSVLLDWGIGIDLEVNRRIHQLAHQLINDPFSGFIEVTPAYSSMAVFFDVSVIQKYDPAVNPFESVKRYLTDLLKKLPVKNDTTESRKVVIPVWYNGPDLENIAQLKKISVSEIISIHSARFYDVFMLGFLPGFAYMGLIDDAIAAPRLSTPRTKVPAGSVGIAGNQTGVYPVDSPGGWQLIGITPIKMFDPDRSEPFLIKAGDQVRFQSISKEEFHTYYHNQ